MSRITPDDSSGSLHDTQSLTDSVTDYPIEHGRRYHKYHEGQYPYPNDELELDRWDMQHTLWRMVNDQRLFLAPLANPKEILDIGTGSGIWPIDMAAIFPDATISGIDLSPTQPAEVPPNVHFYVDDANEAEWMWNENQFDYIRLSNMSGCFRDCKAIMKRAMRHLRPGGYLEWHEFDPRPRCDDDSMPPANRDGGFSEYPLHDWIEMNEKAAEEVEPIRQFRIAHRLSRWMEEAGYQDVDDRITKVPLNTWAKDERLKTLGGWLEQNWLDGLAAYSYKPMIAMGWSKAEIEVFLVSVRRCIQNRKFHVYMNFHVVTARKPLS